MTEFLRDPMWQFVITAITAIAGMFATIFFYLKQRKRKALSYEVLTYAPLLSGEKEYRGKLKIYFEKKPVEQVHLVAVRILNSGNVAIKSDDYERCVSLRFPEEAQVLSVEVAKTNPASLKDDVGYEIVDSSNEIQISPFLLNADDSVTFNMLVNKLEGEVTVDGRIVGVKEIGKLKPFAGGLYIRLILVICVMNLIVGFIGMSVFPMPSLGFLASGLLFLLGGGYPVPFLLSQRFRVLVFS